MAEEFDPYRKWLGIPQHEQPPTHYRLLGIVEFEDDPDVIQNAADRQMAHVRTFQHGQHAQLSQRLLNELAAAKLTLLSEERKAAYDEALLEQELSDEALAIPSPAPYPQDEVAAPPPARKPPAIPPAIAPKPVAIAAAAPSTAKTYVPQPRRQDRPLFLWVIAGVGIVVAIVVAGVFALSQRGNGTDTVVQGSPQPGSPPTHDTRDDGERPHLSVPPEGEPPAATTHDDFAFEATLAAARQALARREQETAHEQLQLASRQAHDDAERSRVDHLHALYVFLQEFWKDVDSGAQRLKPNRGQHQTVVWNGAEYQLLELRGGRARISVDGREESWPLREAPLEAAMMFAAQGSRGDDAAPIYQVAFLLLDEPQGHELGLAVRQREALELYCQSLAKNGPNDALERELLRAGFHDFDFIAIETPAEDDRVAQIGRNEVEEERGRDPEASDGERPDEEEMAESDDPGDDVASTKPVNGSQEQDSADSRLPVPTAAEMNAAKATLEETFRSDFSLARTVETKIELVNKLILAAEDEKEDAALRYCYLERARDVAVGLGNAELLVQIVQQMGADYDIETFEETVRYLLPCGANVGDAVSYETYVDQILFLCFQSIENEQFEQIDPLMRVLQRTAAVPHGAGSVVDPDRARATAKWLEQYLDDRPAVIEALSTLEDDADDAAANLLVGKFFCFYNYDWRRGLPMLAKGNDANLRQLARDETKLSDSVTERIQLADHWFQQASQAESAAAQAMLSRAAYHYGRVLGRLNRTARLPIEQKLQQIEALLQGGSAYLPRT